MGANCVARRLNIQARTVEETQIPRIVTADKKRNEVGSTDSL